MTLSVFRGPNEEHGGWRTYEIPQVQGDLFPEPRDLQSTEGEVRDKAKSLGRERRFEILFGSLTGRRNLRSRVVNVLRQASGDDEAFTVTLDTIAYAKRCNKSEAKEMEFSRTVGRIEQCIKQGGLLVGKMKALLDVGIVFDPLTFYWTPEIIQNRGGGLA